MFPLSVTSAAVFKDPLPGMSGRAGPGKARGAPRGARQVLSGSGCTLACPHLPTLRSPLQLPRSPRGTAPQLSHRVPDHRTESKGAAPGDGGNWPGPLPHAEFLQCPDDLKNSDFEFYSRINLSLIYCKKKKCSLQISFVGSWPLYWQTPVLF